MNLIPDQPGSTPSYWCTWGIQTYSAPQPPGPTWAWPVSQMQEHTLVGDRGWFAAPGPLAALAPDARRDLYLLFDVGWDQPLAGDPNQERWRFGSVTVDAERFPSCTGAPPERLHKLNELARAASWRGAALWVAPQAVGDGKHDFPLSGTAAENYWRERILWSREAGIDYWKVDVGFHAGSAGYRQMMTRLAREHAPGLVLEHAPMAGPFNDQPAPWDAVQTSLGAGRFAALDGRYERALACLTFSDVLRTYDVSSQLSVATTLDRVAALLVHGISHPEAAGLLNCEDEPYLGAALGCAIGLMRHPAWNVYEAGDYDPAQYKRRIDEVTRAVRWARIAPAFGVNTGGVLADERLLTDSWRFGPGDTWAEWVIGARVEQAAPARLARGLPLPDIHAPGDEPPFVVASQHPNGAVAVATLARSIADHDIHTPRADVTLVVPDAEALIGVFGHYASLTLRVPPGDWRVWAQDLAGDEAIEITGRVARQSSALMIPGARIDEIGCSAATPGDLSEPGLVLKLEPAG